MIKTYPTCNAPDVLYTFVGVKLAAALAVERYPSERIAELCGVSVSTVYRWQKGDDFKRLRYEFTQAYHNEQRERLTQAKLEFLRREA